MNWFERLNWGLLLECVFCRFKTCQVLQYLEIWMQSDDHKPRRYPSAQGEPVSRIGQAWALRQIFHGDRQAEAGANP